MGMLEGQYCIISAGMGISDKKPLNPKPSTLNPQTSIATKVSLISIIHMVRSCGVKGARVGEISVLLCIVCVAYGLGFRIVGLGYRALDSGALFLSHSTEKGFRIWGLESGLGLAQTNMKSQTQPAKTCASMGRGHVLDKIYTSYSLNSSIGAYIGDYYRGY